MRKVLGIILRIFTNKVIYGTFLTVMISYFLYHSIVIFLEETINFSGDIYDNKKRKTVIELIKNIFKYVFNVIVVVIILGICGINVTGMLAGLGIAATIIGLALQDTFKDIISGIGIMLENYFIVGDMVVYNDFTGEVISFGLRSTKIRSAKGEILIVANRNIMEIKNISQKKQTIYYQIPVSYEENIDQIESIINKEIIPKIVKVKNVDDKSIKYLGIDKLDDSCVKYLIIISCNRDTQWQVNRDVNKIVLDTFNKKSISIPYNQLEIHYEKEL